MASPLAALSSPPDDDEEEEQQTGSTDSVPAMLTPHEAVLNTGAAKIMGRKNIDKLNARGRKGGRKGKGYADGTSDVEDDNPPGAPEYERGPLANPKPSPAPVKGYQRGTSDVSSDEEGNQYDRATGALVAGASQVRAAAGDRSASCFGSGWTPSQNSGLDSLRSPPNQPNLTPAGLKLSPVAPAAGALAGGLGNNKQVGPVPGAPVSATPNPNPGGPNIQAIPATPGVRSITAPGSDVSVAGARPAATLGFQGREPISPDISTPGLPQPPTGAEVAGGKVRSAIGSGVGALKTAAGKVGDYLSRTAPAPEGADLPELAGRAATTIGGFARGLTGRSIASGVSNAQAARIQQPTAANPTPITDTTPDVHPDESENAITRFGRLPTGLFDNPNTRRKLGYKKTAFAGF